MNYIHIVQKKLEPSFSKPPLIVLPHLHSDLDGEIGSIAPGKTANFTILANNPFTIDPMKIKDIKVHATVYRGKQTRVPK